MLPVCTQNRAHLCGEMEQYMADIVKVTTPMTGYENTTPRQNPITPGDTQIQNVADPTRVNRPDGKTEQKGADNSGYMFRYDSNFETFIQRLRQMPTLTETMSALLLGRMQTLVSSGMSPDMAQELSKFLRMLVMDQSQLEMFLKQQNTASVRFKGAFFDVMREIFNGSDSPGIKNDILQFLKKYNDMASTEHIAKSMTGTIERMAQAMPASARGGLLELLGKLEVLLQAGDRGAALSMLQNQIVPYMGNYIARTHDMGLARTLLSMLTLQMTRYENGSQESMLQAFRQLLGYSGVRSRLGGLDDNSLMLLLRNTEFEKASGNNTFADTFLELASRALRGEAGVEGRQAFENIMHALLLNQSVYMPLTHLMIPLEWQGKMMFSEVWIDPDAENHGKGRATKERTVRLLLKFDIQDLGLFDTVIELHGEKTVNLRIAFPEKLSPVKKNIQSGVTAILKKCGLEPQNVVTEVMRQPIGLSEVFPHLYERKNSINVSI